MSEEYDVESDLKLDFNKDGKIDLALDISGDLIPIGTNIADVDKKRVEAVTQKLQLVFSTPYSNFINSEDPTQPSINFGTVLYEYAGRGGVSDAILKMIIIQTVLSVPDIIGIDGITIDRGTIRNEATINLTLRIVALEQSVLVRVVI